MEHRSYYRALDLRTTTKDNKIVGLIPFDSLSQSLGNFKEIIRSTAFDKTLSSGKTVHSFWSHKKEWPLGNTDNGKLKLRKTARGLQIELFPNLKTSWGRDAYESVRRGDTTGFSFGFNLNPGGESWTNNNVRELLDVNLFECSPCVDPVYSESCCSTDAATCGIRQKQNTYGGNKMNVNERIRQTELSLGRTPSEFRCHGEMLKAIRKAGIENYQNLDPRLYKMQQRAQQADVPSAGGFLLSPDVVYSLLFDEEFSSEVVKRCNVVKAGQLYTELPDYYFKDRAEGSRGPRLYWAKELQQKTETEQKFQSLEFPLFEISGYIPVSDKLIKFTPDKLMEKIVFKSMRQELSNKLEEAILTKNGTASPQGILNSGGTIVVSKETGQAAGTITSTNILDMNNAFYGKSKKRGVWIINDNEVESQLYSLTMTIGDAGSQIPLYINGKLLNKEVIFSEFCPCLGQKGDIILADLHYYNLILAAVEQTVSIHIFFDTNASAFRLVAYANGASSFDQPITPLNAKDLTEVSPFVVLEDRE